MVRKLSSHNAYGDGCEVVSQRFERFEEVPPDPAATIESLRALGYSLEAAVADIVDNSVAHDSTQVDIRLHWAGADSWCAVIDNGSGMSEDALRQAMRVGSRDPLAERGPRDLGRFGLGLKTASFSQARELIVMTRTRRSASVHVRSWDLDHVRAVGRWELRRSAPEDAVAVLSALDHGSHGTIILWRRLDKLVNEDTRVESKQDQRRVLEHLESLGRHLGMTFARFLSLPSRPLRIYVNGRPVDPWDPFLSSHPATQRLSHERLAVRGAVVLVRPYVLPHRSKLKDSEFSDAAGPFGWNGHQGFFVYRHDRLIVAGDWLGLGFTRDDDHNLARISVDVPSSLDREWSIDVTKGKVRTPNSLRDDLKRIAKDTRRRARAVVHHRGAAVGARPRRGVVAVWQQRRRHGEVVFRLNREHPLIADLLARERDTGRELAAVLDLVEETVPAAVLPAAPVTERRAFEGRPPDDILLLASSLYDSLLGKGLTRSQAAEQLLHCEPFNEYPDVMQTIWGNE